MPTNKRRVGFIPRSEVLDLLIKLSYESNLSFSKIVNILVEEALCKRGLFNIRTSTCDIESNEDRNHNKKERIESLNKKFTYNFKNNFLKEENLNNNKSNHELLDNEIYAKFLMFLQFEERMKKRDL